MEFARGLLWGEVFSTSFLIIEGKVLDLEAHFARLESNARFYFDLPAAPEGWFEQYFVLLPDYQQGYWRARLDLFFPEKLNFVLGATSWEQLKGQLHVRPLGPKPVALHVEISTDEVGPRFWPNDFKLSDYKRASYERRQLKSDDVLWWNAKRHICELSTSNIFFYDGQKFLTPASNGYFYCGLERERLINFLKTSGREIGEMDLSLDQVENYKAALATNSVYGLQLIQRIGKKEFQITPFFEQFVKEYQSWKNFNFRLGHEQIHED